MTNYKLLTEIDTVIKYLKTHGGYNYKLYNNSCPDISKPDSNIVEYALDIKDFILNIYQNTNKEKFIKIEICKMIMDNLDLFDLDDSKLLKLKNYVKNNYNDEIKETPSNILQELCKEALMDLITVEHLFDFRN